MMKTTHTSAPWHVGERKDGIIQILHSDDSPGAISSPLAKVVNRKSWSFEAEANAYLIAAAPDMREALKDMLAGWRYIRQQHGDLYGVGWDRAEQKAIAALAKADGS